VDVNALKNAAIDSGCRIKFVVGEAGCRQPSRLIFFRKRLLADYMDHTAQRDCDHNPTRERGIPGLTLRGGKNGFEMASSNFAGELSKSKRNHGESHHDDDNTHLMRFGAQKNGMV